jgi:hypothetical protein
MTSWMTIILSTHAPEIIAFLLTFCFSVPRSRGPCSGYYRYQRSQFCIAGPEERQTSRRQVSSAAGV